ncbi:MAG: hypothetical protein A3J38_10480 [Gammaproteobacteria bacterium RIFCSPHIGHO2_12_FULL_45_9]|nr:MAG: hypothetical protein A3J38_10480 [Gammaproteobacteria bacterium RIFCSPHIGHO2_12_FULL_45_9]
MDRLYTEVVRSHLKSYGQMVFIGGARQVGKTTVSETVMAERARAYSLNWDNQDDQMLILRGPQAIIEHFNIQSLAEGSALLVFDELHKYTDWRNFIKGFYDTYKSFVNIIVTGSAKLDIFRYSGDSLMGRYFLYRVHPVSVREYLDTRIPPQEISPPQEIEDVLFQRLLIRGGFPEPFIKDNTRFFNTWQKLREQQLFEEDIQSITRIREIAQMRMLAVMLKNQAGQLVNFHELSKQIRVSSETIASWVETLCAFYYCFSIKPWHTNITRSLLKQPKIYLYDWSLIQDVGARCENFIASHLLKAVQFWTDTGLGNYDLYFLRDKEKREVDFLVTKDEKPWFLVEAKHGDNARISKNLTYFQQETQAAHAFQVSLTHPFVNQNCFDYREPIIVPAKTFLSQLI